MAVDDPVQAEGPVNVVDNEYWASMPGWTISEAAALLLDIDPDRLPTQQNNVMPGSKGWEYMRLRRRLKRAHMMDDLDDPMRPTDFLEWAVSNRLIVQNALHESVKSGRKLKNWRAKYFAMKRQRDAILAKIDDSVSPKERTSLLKIVLGLARGSLKHKPNNPHTVAKIEKILKDENLALSNDSIRAYLTEADEKFAV